MRSTDPRSILALAAVVAVLALLVPGAQAQQPTLSVQLVDVPENFPEMQSNASAAVAFSVRVRMTNVVCSEPSTLPVVINAQASGAPPFFSIVQDPPNVIEVSVPAGAYPSADAVGQGQPFTATVPASVQVESRQVLANATIPISITAVASGLPSACQGAGSVGETSSETATVTATLIAPPEPVPEPVPEPERGLPGFGALVGIVAAVGAARMMRRR